MPTPSMNKVCPETTYRIDSYHDVTLLVRSSDATR